MTTCCVQNCEVAFSFNHKMYIVSVLVVCGQTSLQKMGSSDHFCHNIQTSVKAKKEKKKQWPCCYHMLLTENFLTL